MYCKIVPIGIIIQNLSKCWFLKTNACNVFLVRWDNPAKSKIIYIVNLLCFDLIYATSITIVKSAQTALRDSKYEVRDSKFDIQISQI